MLSFAQFVPENGHVIGELACGHEGDPECMVLPRVFGYPGRNHHYFMYSMTRKGKKRQVL